MSQESNIQDFKQKSICTASDTKNNQKKKMHNYFRKLYRQRYLWLMILPFLVWVFIFKFIPLWGWTMAFQDYKLGESGMFNQHWVGFKHFITLFQEKQFYRVMRNTLSMSGLELLIGFPLPIIFAILLNEIRFPRFKKAIQTVSYLPYFVSWVIVASLISKMLSTDGGIVNEILLCLGLVNKPIQFMAQPRMFWMISTLSEVWKNLGWNSIIFLAAIAGIDQNLNEAATVDGANRWKRIWHITLPSISPTIIVVLVLNIGWLISIGYEKQFLLGNSVVSEYCEVLDLYILNYGIGLMRYSYGTAIGVFKSVVSIVLLLLANRLAKKVNGVSAI
ncbi:MAG: ABC transporter permease subunit [Oscillospiraceae bacterium]